MVGAVRRWRAGRCERATFGPRPNESSPRIWPSYGMCVTLVSCVGVAQLDRMPAGRAGRVRYRLVAKKPAGLRARLNTVYIRVVSAGDLCGTSCVGSSWALL